MRRWIAAAVIVAAAAFAMYRWVLVPYRCNLIEGTVARATDSIGESHDSYRAREIAARNLEQLAKCSKDCKNDVGMLMLRGGNLTVLDRHHAAAEVFSEALALDHRPELYFALGLAQLHTGEREKAIASFVKVGEFSGPAALYEVPDAKVRWEATTIVGRRLENLMAQRKLIDQRDRLVNGGFEIAGSAGAITESRKRGGSRSAAQAWDLYNAADVPIRSSIRKSTRDGKKAIHVVTSTGDSGLRQNWPAGMQTPRVQTSAWVYVVSGRVYIGSGTGERPLANAYSTGTGRWERLEGVNVTCPGKMTVIFSDSAGAEFYVDEITVRPTLAAAPCGQ